MGEHPLPPRPISDADRQPESHLFSAAYRELKKLAHHRLTLERSEHSLQTTALVHEVYLRLANIPADHWNSRQHFFAVAAKAMRQILVDHARTRRAAKRGLHFERQITEDVPSRSDKNELNVLALDEALSILQREHPRKARLVELRFFTGLPLCEAAECLNISLATAKRDWAYAKAWLYGQLHD